MKNYLSKFSLKNVKSITEAFDIYQKFIIEIYPETDEDFELYRSINWPSWASDFSENELNRILEYDNGITIPEQLEEFYRKHGELTMEEGLDIYSPDRVLRETDFQTLTESWSFNTEHIGEQTKAYLNDNYCHFATLNIGQRSVFALFDKEGHGFNTIVQDVDNIFEEQFENLCTPVSNRKMETLNDVVYDLLYRLMEDIVINLEE